MFGNLRNRVWSGAYVIAMTLGILDILSKNYVSGILYLIIGLMFFIDSFDIMI